jgi:hypothetical protein
MYYLRHIVRTDDCYTQECSISVICRSKQPFIRLSMLYSHFFGPWPLFFSFVILYSSPPWSGYQLVTRPLSTYNTAQTHIDIHDSSGIRNHDLSVRAGEDSSCLTPRGHCNRRSKQPPCINYVWTNTGTHSVAEWIQWVWVSGTFILLGLGILFLRAISPAIRPLPT